GDHLGTHAERAGRCPGDQPLLSTRSNRQEGCLIWRSGPWRAVEWTLRWWSEVSRIVPRLAWHRRFPTRDLVCAVATDVDDDDLVLLLPHPDLLADVVIRHGILATFD